MLVLEDAVDAHAPAELLQTLQGNTTTQLNTNGIVFPQTRNELFGRGMTHSLWLTTCDSSPVLVLQHAVDAHALAVLLQAFHRPIPHLLLAHSCLLARD